MSEATKDTLRFEAIKHRDRINPNDADEDSDLASALFFANITPGPENIVALYWAKGREFDVSGILLQLAELKIPCALPVVQKDDRVLRFALWHEDMIMEEGPYKIMQPVIDDNTEWVDPDIVVVPLLAFDRKGSRLGYGGGYYDATLRALREKGNITAVGIGFAKQAVIFNLPTEPHDEKLDWVITPQKASNFSD